MFELFSGEHRRVPHRGTVPVTLSIGVHLLVNGAVVASAPLRRHGIAQVRSRCSNAAAVTAVNQCS